MYNKKITNQLKADSEDLKRCLQELKECLEEIRIHRMVMDKAKQIELTEEEVNDLAKKEGQE